jgi:hypothetical protein
MPELTLETIAVPRRWRGRQRKYPERLIYDEACNADAWNQRLVRRGIDVICPYHKNRKKPRWQDG